ncbi:MAG TPA: glutamine-synthetase adenylyltransferase, partial [Xanthomonadales bacterium]|nr:glutamine-synthetase adenylyltransferase [Xanthomonadales bacterium]
EQMRTGFPQRIVPDSDSAGAGMWLAARNGAQPDGSPLSQALQVCAEALGRQALSNRAAQRLDRFMPALLQDLIEARHPEPVLKDLFDLVLAISRRSAYLSLLVQNPAALDRMVALFAASDWIAATVIRHPALLDELIDPALGRWLPDREEMDQTLRRMMRSHGDPETALSNLNHVKLAFTLRIAVAELENMISAQRVQRSLTDLAECVIESCYQLALEEVRSRHGALPGPGLGIVGYGSLGAAELGYASDLDLIFLYTDRSGPSDGPRPLAREAWFIKLARRLLSYLTALTPSGRLYEVDTRLRPNGRAGLLVSSLSAFESYQMDKAWTWELQALCRGRPCAGDPGIGVSFSKIRKSALARPRDEAETRDQILDMRQRWREVHPDGDPLKFGDGGLIDIGFVAQLGVLLNAASHPQVLEDSGTPEQLEALVSAGWLTRVQHETLSRAYQSLTRRAHMGLLQREAPDQLPADPACAELCRALLGGPD